MKHNSNKHRQPIIGSINHIVSVFQNLIENAQVFNKFINKQSLILKNLSNIQFLC